MSNPTTLSRSAPSAVARLDALAITHTEWAPWLCVLREAIAALSDRAWDAHPPHTKAGTGLSPLLAAAVLRPDSPAVAHLLVRLIAVARAQGLVALVGATERAETQVDHARAIFLAAVNNDAETLDRQASRAGATREGWGALSQLLSMPYLHACARRWAASPRADWSQGYCPVCGAWPAFAEVRGIERARHLRCGRCGVGWSMPVLTCIYCANTEHHALGTLVADDKRARWTVEFCRRCSGYLKSVTTLQPTPPSEIVVSDLSSIEFDIVAVERGFLRPQAQGFDLGASLVVAAEHGQHQPPERSSS
jgi:FdhE protein